MSTVVVCSAKGAPGVSTAALALAMTWPETGRPVCLVEADVSGGSSAARWDLGYEPGLLSLAGAGRRGVDVDLLLRHSQQLAGVHLLCGPASAEQARSAVSTIGGHLAALGSAGAVDLIVDVGRLWATSPALDLARSAALSLVVTRSSLSQVQHVPSLTRLLTEQRAAPMLMSIGDEPYRATDIASFAEIPLLGVLAADDRGADALCGGGGSERLMRRSPLLRSARAIGEAVVGQLRPRLTEPGESQRRAADALDGSPEVPS